MSAEAEHSPSRSSALDQPHRSPQAVNFLAVALCPLIFWMLRGDIGSLLAGLFLLGLFGLAAHLILSALEDEEVGLFARRRLPRKITGSALIGVGVTLLALIQLGGGLLAPALGLLGFALSVVAFGADLDVSFRIRLRGKVRRETRKLVDTTERVLAAIPIRVSVLEDEPALLQAKAFRATMLDMLERHSDVIDSVSEELREVITEAAEATDAFVTAYAEDPDPRTKRRYMVLLKELADAFGLYLDEVAGTPDKPVTQEEDDLFDEMRGRQAA